METVEQLLVRNLAEVFGEADSSKRAKAMESIWARDGELIDPQGRFVGHNAVSAAVGGLHARFPGFVFTPIGSPQAFHEVGRLSWGHGPNGAPPKVTGVDVVRVRDGRIVALYTFVDVPASGPGQEWIQDIKAQGLRINVTGERSAGRRRPQRRIAQIWQIVSPGTVLGYTRAGDPRPAEAPNTQCVRHASTPTSSTG